MPTSLGGGHGLVISRRLLLIVGLTVSIILVVCAFTLLLILQGSFSLNVFFSLLSSMKGSDLKTIN